MLDLVKYFPHFSPGRIRIEQVAGEPMTPKDVQAKIAASAPSLSLVVQYEDMRTQVQAWTAQEWWLKKQLQSSSAPTVTNANQ